MRVASTHPSSGTPLSDGSISRFQSENPISPAKLPVAFSSITQYPNPIHAQCPTVRSTLAQASSSVSGFPPMYRVTTGSAHIAAHSAKSSRRCPRNRSRSVSITGTSPPPETNPTIGHLISKSQPGTCYHFSLMSVQRCATCGKEFERNFGDSSSSLNCPACDLQHAQTIRTSQSPGTLSPPSFPVTIALIAASVLVFAIMVLRGVSAFNPTPQQAIAFGADFGPLTLSGQWWRLVTSMFVHFGLIHLGLNMWCLWNLGRAAEHLLGRFSYLLAYLASGIFGSIASVYWHPLAAGAGASGAIFGLAGVLVSFVYLKKTPSHLQINRGMLGSLGTFIFYNLIYGAAIPGISNAAHLGGLLMGLAVGALLPSAAASESARRTQLSMAVALSAIVLVGSAVATKRLRAGITRLVSTRHSIAAGLIGGALGQPQVLSR